MSIDSDLTRAIAPVVPARMVCEIQRGVLVTWPGEPVRHVPAGTEFLVDAWAGYGWYRGRLCDDPRALQLQAKELGLPPGD